MAGDVNTEAVSTADCGSCICRSRMLRHGRSKTSSDSDTIRREVRLQEELNVSAEDVKQLEELVL